MVYFDNQATTPTDPSVIEVVLQEMQSNFGNSSSSEHVYGWRAEMSVESARAIIAEKINCQPNEIIFTSGTTESNNLAFRGLLKSIPPKKNKIITSKIEHSCILELTKYLENQGISVEFVQINSNGVIDLRHFKKILTAETYMVSLMWGNNEIGVVNPIKEIGDLCNKMGVILHTDAAQTLGKIPMDLKNSNVTLLSASAHKIYGPKGIGFLYANSAIKNELAPLIIGGGHEQGIRSGTLNVPAISGFAKAVQIATDNLEDHFSHYLKLRRRFLKNLTDSKYGFVINGPEIEEISPNRLNRLPNNLNIYFPRIRSKEFLRDLNGIAFSSSSACTDSNLKASHVLSALGLKSQRIKNSFRFGFGRFNTEEEIDYVTEKIITHIKKKYFF